MLPQNWWTSVILIEQILLLEHILFLKFNSLAYQPSGPPKHHVSMFLRDEEMQSFSNKIGLETDSQLGWLFYMLRCNVVPQGYRGHVSRLRSEHINQA